MHWCYCNLEEIWNFKKIGRRESRWKSTNSGLQKKNRSRSDSNHRPLPSQAGVLPLRRMRRMVDWIWSYNQEPCIRKKTENKFKIKIAWKFILFKLTVLARIRNLLKNISEKAFHRVIFIKLNSIINCTEFSLKNTRQINRQKRTEIN